MRRRTLWISLSPIAVPLLALTTLWAIDTGIRLREGWVEKLAYRDPDAVKKLPKGWKQVERRCEYFVPFRVVTFRCEGHWPALVNVTCAPSSGYFRRRPRCK